MVEFEEGGHHDEDGGHHDEDGGHHDEDGGHHDEDGGHHDEDGGHHDEDGGHQDEDGGHQDEDGGHQDEDGGHKDEDGGHHDEDGGHHDEDGGHHDEDGGHHDEDGGHHDEDGGHHDEDGGHKDEDGRHQDKDGGRKDEGWGHHDENGGHQDEDGGHQDEHGGHQDEDGEKLELEERGENEEDNYERVRRMELLLKIKKRKMLGNKARKAKENMTPKLLDTDIIIKENTNIKQMEKETEESIPNNEEPGKEKKEDENEKGKKVENILMDEGKEINHSIKFNSFSFKNREKIRNKREIKKIKESETVNEDTELLCSSAGTLETLQCFYCGVHVPPSSACTWCKNVYFCSKEHAEIHRPQEYCFPFIVKRDPKVGRYCIASRSISPCELILREDAAAAGPYAKSKPVCLQCFKKIDGSYVCPRCKYPVCNLDCSKGNLHEQECNFFVEKNYQCSIKCFNKPNSNYACITPLRMLLKKRSDPKTFDRINFLMDHVEERTATQSNINMMYLKVVTFLKKTCDTPEFDETEISRTIGILRTNGMKLEQVGSCECAGVALYPIYCLLNHACYNNTNYTKYPDLHLELRAQTGIKAGEEITTRYVSSTLGNYRRQRDIQKYWFFDCQCKRCRDVTELGTHMSSIRCNICSGGFLSPEHSFLDDSPWCCDSCTNKWDKNKVTELMDTLEEDNQNLDTSRVEDLEEAVFKYGEQTQLHQNHYLVVELCHTLIHRYAALSTIRKLSRPEEERKIQLCFHVLNVLSKVDPGFTKWRGNVLQELVSSLMTISKQDLKANIITEEMFKKRLYYGMVSLSQARKCQFAGFSS
ncbi:uncharacterized protein LOC111706243 [Eurytemora carolleeae]|uniref:uncharacterized protein LOC111706243 n=1 Tax=Eurytemora carolleeae TaxID=1294199 RepID=UPI000C7907CA|nr:uncharacterized protein LOC111706243 [Eurytemora carolleeae]|eukprot:XP_023334833.1 uncharacterized protein LOC111706243 [Eurytemora affinis]